MGAGFISLQSTNFKVYSEYPETDSTGAIAITTDTISFRYFEPRPQRGKKAGGKKESSCK